MLGVEAAGSTKFKMTLNICCSLLRE